MEIYEISDLLKSLVELREQLITQDVPSNTSLLKITDEKIEYLIKQLPS